MRNSRLGSMAGLAGAALLVAACSSSGSSPTQPGPSAATTATSAVAGTPPVPTNFTATRPSGSVPCPSADETCSQTDLAWQSTADAGTRFRIYEASVGLDPSATCEDVKADAEAVLDTEPGIRSVALFEPMATGAGAACGCRP